MPRRRRQTRLDGLPDLYGFRCRAYALCSARRGELAAANYPVPRTRRIDERAPLAKKLSVLYDCLNCTAYCCTYGHIPVTGKDIRRLAKHFDISETKAQRKFTKKGDKKGSRVLRHTFDAVFESACVFLDQETRQCTIHRARPGICREYPGGRRCEYYDFLEAERGRQEEPDMVVAAYPVE